MKNVNLRNKKEIIQKRSSLVFSSQILLADKQEMKTTSLARATQESPQQTKMFKRTFLAV